MRPHLERPFGAPLESYVLWEIVQAGKKGRGQKEVEQAQSGREGLPRPRVQGMAALLVCTKSLLSFQINAREEKNNFLWVVHKAKAKVLLKKKKSGNDEVRV